MIRNCKERSSTLRDYISNIKIWGCTYDRARIRTWNLLIRSQTRYPLRHAALCQLFDLYIICYDAGIIHLFIAPYVTLQQLPMLLAFDNLRI